MCDRLLSSSGIQTRGNGAKHICKRGEKTKITADARKTTDPFCSSFAILQVFLEAGKEFCELRSTKDDLSDLTIFLDRTKIESHGRPVVNKFLQRLQVFKATADFAEGKKLYETYTNVDEWYATKLRPEVIRQAKPRKVFVQANTVLQGDNVVLKEYEATPEGMIQSFVDREYI